jgi:hypothetical protein
MIDDGDCGAIGGMKIGKPKYSKKTCPSSTLSTTNPTLQDLGSNPGFLGWETSDLPPELWLGPSPGVNCNELESM